MSQKDLNINKQLTRVDRSKQLYCQTENLVVCIIKYVYNCRLKTFEVYNTRNKRAMLHKFHVGQNVPLVKR